MIYFESDVRYIISETDTEPKRKTSKGLTIILINTIVLAMLIILLLQSNLGRKSWIFTVLTWDRSISMFFSPELDGFTGILGAGHPYSEFYYFRNFSNDAEDFNLIQNLFRNDQTGINSETFKEKNSENGVKEFRKWC
jgi:hypothetical protein